MSISDIAVIQVCIQGVGVLVASYLSLLVYKRIKRKNAHDADSRYIIIPAWFLFNC